MLVDRGPLGFAWTPLLLGAAYLAAALAGGRRGGHWSTACVLLGWGASVVIVTEYGATLDVGVAPAYLAGAGLGALGAAGLERAGFGADLLGVAAATLVAGVTFALSGRVAVLEQASTFAAALAVLAAVNLALTLRR